MRKGPRLRSTTEVRRVSTNKCRWRRQLAAPLLASLVLASCGPEENTLNDTEEHYLQQRLAAAVPQLDVFSIDAGGNGFTTQYGLSVQACPKPDEGVNRVRAQLRKTARVLWNHADTYWDDLKISVECRGARESSNPKPPLGIELDMTAAGAKQLWGDPTEVEHQPEISPTTSKAANGGAGAEFGDIGGGSSFSLPKGYEMFGPDPHGNRVPSWTVYIPYHTPTQTRNRKLDQIIMKLWHDHPARVRGIALHAISAPPPDWPDDRQHRDRWEKQRPEWRHQYSAKQLRARFGSRAADLPR